MSTIAFFIPGEPQAQKRHRSVRMGKSSFIRTYDPSAGDKADFLAMCLNHRPERLITTPIIMRLAFVFTRPLGHFKAGDRDKGVKDSMRIIKHTKKPDIDNLVKFILDSLNKKYWADDSQVYSLTCIKKYTDETAPNPGIDIEITYTNE